MLDTRLVQGLLIVACVSLLFGIVMTWVDINRHQVPGGVAAAAPAEPAEQPAEPAEQPAEPPEQSPGEEPEGEQPQALRNAPQGTWGFFSLNVPRLLQSPIVKEQQIEQQLSSQVPPDAFRTASFYVFPKQGPQPGWSGTLTFEAEARSRLEDAAKQDGEAVTVGGTSAYRITRQATREAQTPQGMAPGGMNAAPQTMFVTFADDTTALMGGSQADLETMIDAYGSGGGASERLGRLAARFSDSALSGAAVVPDQMAGMLRQQAGPQNQFIQGLQGGGIGVDLTEQIELGGLVRFAQASQAQQAVQKLQSGIDNMKQQAQANPQTQQMMGPMVAVLDKVNLSTEGADLNVAANMTQEDLKALMLPAMMMMGSMGGGRGQMPMGPSQAPPSR